MKVTENKELISKFQEVAIILGSGWRYNQLETANYRITLTNGRKKIFIEYAKNNMLHVAGAVTRRNDLRDVMNYCQYTSINTSKNKTARQIASDINKRLLSKATPIMDEYLENEQNILKEIEDKKIRFNLIERILGNNGSKSNFEQSKYYMNLEKVRGDLYFRADFSTNINLTGLSFDQTCNLLNYLKQMQA